MPCRPTLLRDERGFTLISTFLLLLLLLTLGASALFYSALDLRSSSHYETGNQALYAAESGLMHGLSSINGPGVINFQSDVVNRWSQIYGATQRSMPGYANIQYTVTAAASTTDPGNSGTITAVGISPLQGRRVLRVTLTKGGFDGARGAIYLAADSVTSTFKGNAFTVDGNNHTTSGTLANDGITVPGISTRNDAVTNSVTNSLSNQQKDNVQGEGFSLDPLTPSVLTTGGPDTDDLDQIVSYLLGNTGTVTTSTSKFNGNDTFGTVSSPAITHMTSADVQLNGNAQGAGILVVDGSLTINGSLNFIGWIIVRGDTVINSTASADDDTVVLGNATIFGSLWTGHLTVSVGGSAIVDYCDTCMRLADGTGGANVQNVPRPMKVVSWQEVL